MNRKDFSQYNAIENIEKYFSDPYIGILTIGHESQICENIRIALRNLDYEVKSGTKFDREIKEVVLKFQKDHKHKNQDGVFGPGTRRLLAKVLYSKVGYNYSEIFERRQEQPARVFISYAWGDIDRVNKIDQWLRDKGIMVDRDNRLFLPGKKLPDEISFAVKRADKVLVMYSKNSKDRDWPKFEIKIAEELENIMKKELIIYLLLDDLPLPKHDPHRIAVKAMNRKLKDFGEDLLRGILSVESKPPKYKYDEEETFN